MSNVINEAEFIGSDNNMAKIIAPREQEKKRKEKAEETQTLRASLMPAVSILTEIIDEEVATNSNIATYTPLIDEASPDGNQIYQEFRARELYGRKLMQLKKLIEKAAAEVNDE